MLFEVIEGKKSSGRIVRVLMAVALSLAMMVSLVTPVWALEGESAANEDGITAEEKVSEKRLSGAEDADEVSDESKAAEPDEAKAEPEVKESAKAEPKAEPKAEAKAEPETDEDEKEPEAEEKADVFGAGTLSNDTVKKYLVKVTYSEKAEIPEGASLVVKEIKKSDDEYKAQASDTAEAVGSSVDELSYLKMFDISIVDKDGNEIEPADKVDVKIEYKDPIEGIDQDKLKVVHFAEKETEVIVPETKTEDGKVEELSFETSSFSIYSVVSNNTTTDLDGKTFAIINRYKNTAMQGHATSNRKLAAAAVTVDTRNGQDYIRTTEDVTFWTFESAGGNKYYIKSDEGKYLNITGTNNNGTISVSDTPQDLAVTAGTGDRPGRVRITNGDICASNINGNVAGGYGASTAYNDNDWLSLYDMEAFDPDFAAEKISVQDIKDAQRLLIYRSIYNPETEKYEDYVIDGNGNLVKVWDKSDQVVGRSAVSPVWVVTIGVNSQGEPTGYYIFRNEETELVLSPQADGTLVAPYDSPTTSGVTLNGRRDGKYISTIEKWDSSAWAWYGYEFTRDSEGNEILKSGTGEHSQELSFAAYISNETHELHPVKTISSKDAGIVINMFNYPDRNTIANVTGSDGYAEGKLPAQHASMTLNSEGYPTFKSGASNGKTLFDPEGTHFQGTGDNLFLESIYNSTGYYEYNAFNNFAHYDKASKSFTVYQETGTPSNDNKFYFKRGNFFPYNNLDVNRPATNQNMYDGSGNQLDIHDPTDHGTLYMVQDPDFYYGMTVEATFMQPKDGLDRGDPVVYEFNGDDDLWIYIDGVLILDIGGVHDAWPGSINFATGDIHGKQARGAGGATTIKQCFKNAGVFPDGTPWDDSRVDEYFKGNTFIDYGSHTFKMFYMEHGAGASNLEMRFNLPVIEKGKFTVEKQLEGTDQQKYANVYFAYQAFRKDGEHNIPLHSAVYEGTTDPVQFYDDVVINGKTYDNVFYLKPGEAATFDELAEEIGYFVQEIGIGSDYYDQVTVNDVKIDGVDVTAVDGIYPTTVATVGTRARVMYANRLSEKNKTDLRITKRLAEGCVSDGDTFEFRLLLENPNGELVPYSTADYYIQDDNGDYYRYLNGNLVNNGKTAIVASVSGNNGTIAGIPANFTVVIKDLVSDTDFYVEEIRNPAGWTLEDKEVVEGTCDKSDLSGRDWSGETVPADGKTKLDTDAKVVFTNGAAERLIVNKVWDSGDLVAEGGHGAVNVALFKTEGSSLALVNGSLKTITAPATSVVYRVVDVTKYTVREVKVEGTDITPIEDGHSIVISGETTTVKNNASDTYVATYEVGEVVEAHEGQDGETVPTTREDTVTNTMKKTTVVKVDENDTPLAGAKFRLLGSDKRTPITGYSDLVTQNNGIVFENAYFPNGLYYLEEMETPAGYIGLSHMLLMTVNEGGISLTTDVQTAPTVYEDKNAQNLTYEFHVVNNPGVELPSSGGIGTTLFYVFGALIVAGCILLIAARRRMQ